MDMKATNTQCSVCMCKSGEGEKTLQNEFSEQCTGSYMHKCPVVCGIFVS